MVKPSYFILFITLAFTQISFSGKGKGYPDNLPDSNNSWKEYNTRLRGLSGLCYNKSQNALLIATDYGEIHEISFEGKRIRKFPFSGKNDFEAITINPETGDIYLADERNMKIFRLSNDEKSLKETVRINITDPVHNKGLEGVTYGNDTLYITNQTSPTRLFKYCLKTQTLQYKDVTFARYLSDICFDSTDNTLWIVDSKQQAVFHCHLNGNVIASQKIPMVEKAEALLVNRTKKIIWAGCDKTGILYKIELKI